MDRSNRSAWHINMRGAVVDARLVLDANCDAVLGLCAAQIEQLRAAGEAFRVSVIESGALNGVAQNKYIDQLRTFERALAMAERGHARKTYRSASIGSQPGEA